MEQDTEYTKVIFRKYPEGDIIALFPEIPESIDGWECMCYQHIGQHGGADPLIARDHYTELAKPEEYADLQSELESLGYRLQICKKFARNAFAIRKQEIERRYGLQSRGA